MEPIFDLFAHTVGWLEGDTAFSQDGRPVAFIEDGAVFTAKDGHYLGYFDGGLFRDHLGCVVAFARRACRCTVLPIPQETRVPPTIQPGTMPGRDRRPAAPPRMARPLLNRSCLDWERFVSGDEARWPWETRS